MRSRVQASRRRLDEEETVNAWGAGEWTVCHLDYVCGQIHGPVLQH